MSQIRKEQILTFNADVIGSTLTGYSSGAGTVSSADTLLQGFNKLNGNQALYALLGGATFTGAVVLAADPVTALGATTKQYVDNLINGIVITEAAVVSTANLTLSGEQTIDGFTTSASTILVTGQSTATQNGVYVTAAGAWARATEYSTGPQLVTASILIKNGTVNAGTQWYNTNASITIGSTSITFVKSAANSYTASGGITLTGLNFAITTGGVTNGMLANSTISGVALGGTLFALTATNSTLTFSGSYTGTAAQTVGLNLSNANTWAALQTFGTNISIGGVTATGAQGTGNVVFATSPTLTTPVLGVATATTINKITITQPASGSTLTIVDGKTLTISNTLTFAGTDISTLNIGAGGTLGSNAFTSTAFLASANYIVREVPTGSINSSNTTYTLAHTPISGKESVYLNGLLLIITTDYTISTNTITMVVAPFTGDSLVVTYIF